MRKFLSVLLSVMMILSTVSFAAPMAWTGADDAYESVVEVETPAAELTEEVTGDLFDSINDDENPGILIADLDFSNTTYPDSAGNISQCGPIASYSSKAVTIPSEFPAGATIRVEAPVQYAATAYDQINGNNVFRVTGGTYPFFNFRICDPANIWETNDWSASGFTGFPEGVYYIVADVAHNASNANKGRAQLRIAGIKGNLAGVSIGGAGIGPTPTLTTTMTNYVLPCVITEDKTTGVKTVTTTGGTKEMGDRIKSIGIFFGSAATTDIFYVDNVKLYYKPLTVEVEVDGGENPYIEAATVNVSTQGVTAAQIVGDIVNYNEYYAVAGVEIDGVKYSADDVIYLAEDTTATILWEEIDTSVFNDGKGYEIFTLDFEDATVTNCTFSNENQNYLVSKFGAKVGPLVSSFSDLSVINSIYMNYSSLSSASVVEENGNKYLKGITDGGGYPLFQMVTGYGKRGLNGDYYGWSAGKKGVFTVVHDYYTSLENTYTTYRFASYSASATQESEVVQSSKTPGTNVPANTWTTFTVTHKDDTSAVSTDYVKIHNAASEPAEGEVHAIDNVAVYFKPLTAKVTLLPVGYNCDSVVLDWDTATAITKSDIVSSFEVPFGYELESITDYKGNEISDSTTICCNTVFNVNFKKIDMSKYIGENGFILFSLSFDNAESVAAFTPTTSDKTVLLSNFADVLFPYFNKPYEWALVSSGLDVVGIEDGALKTQWDGTGRWPQLLIGNPTNNINNGLVGTHGTYTLHTEVMAKDLSSNFTNINTTNNGYVDGVHKSATGIGTYQYDIIKSSGYTEGTWAVSEKSINTRTDLGGSDGLDNDDINKITHVVNHSAAASAQGYFYFDNITLYWRPETVNLTVDLSEAGLGEVYLENVPATSTIADVITLVSNKAGISGYFEYGKLTGFRDEDGTALSKLNLVMDTKLIADFEAYNVIADHSFEFTSDATGVGNISSFFSVGTYGNVNDIGNGGDLVSTAIGKTYNTGYYTKDGNFFHKAITIKAADTGKAGDCGWDVDVIHGIRDQFKLNPTTDAGEVEGFVVKYRYTNVPSVLTGTYTDRTGATKSYTLENVPNATFFFKNNNNGYDWGGGYCSASNKKTVKEGEWCLEYIPMTSYTTYGHNLILVDPAPMTDGMIFEIDYIRAVGAPVETYDVTFNVDGVKTVVEVESGALVPSAKVPEITADDFKGWSTTKDDASTIVDLATYKVTANVTLYPFYGVDYTPAVSDEVSIRVSTPTGLRFKASMGTDVQVEASEYGWVVTRKALVTAAGLTNEDITVDQQAFKVIVGHAFGNGVTNAKIFESDDTTVAFTAVLYNIPAGKYGDVYVARPFTKVGSDYYYGTAIEKTISEVAAAIKAGGYVGLSEYQKSVIDSYIVEA